MPHIIMGKDECGAEFRADECKFKSADAASEWLPEARENYPEARSLWVEEYKDKAYFASLNADRYARDELDLY
jgi:hypothetical protein